MKRIVVFMGVALPLVIAGHAFAQEEEGRPVRDGEMRERMLEEFDEDGDGELNDEERQTAREAMRERRGNRPEGRRGDRGRGRPAPPDPNQLFDEFDANKDGQLSRGEFMKLTDAQRERRRPRPPRGEEFRGPPPRDDRPGPPPEEREFGPRPPLPFRNQFDGPPGPPSPRAEAGSPERFGRPPRPRGPEGRDFSGPDPNRLFDRFDENGDEQLSREEFMKLSDRMREMRDRFGQGPPRGEGPLGPGFGDPRRSGGEAPPRPQRPEPEPDAEKPAIGEDTNSA